MASKNHRLTDEQVEQEIQRLSESPMVKLARKEIRVRNRRRQYLYHLRQMEKRGIALTDAGWTYDKLDEMDAQIDAEVLTEQEGENDEEA